MKEINEMKGAGRSIRGIAGDLGIARNTVRRYPKSPEALARGKPRVFNTDQGSQLTSGKFTQVLQDHGVKISMYGKGRCADNIFLERLWRTVKHEEVYLKAYPSASEARRELGAYLPFYTTRDRIRPWATGPRPRCSTKPSMFRRKIGGKGGAHRNRRWYQLVSSERSAGLSLNSASTLSN